MSCADAQAAPGPREAAPARLGSNPCQEQEASPWYPSGSFCSSSHHEKRKRSSDSLFLVNCPQWKGKHRNHRPKFGILIIRTFQLFILHPQWFPNPFCNTQQNTAPSQHILQIRFLGALSIQQHLPIHSATFLPAYFLPAVHQREPAGPVWTRFSTHPHPSRVKVKLQTWDW